MNRNILIVLIGLWGCQTNNSFDKKVDQNSYTGIDKTISEQSQYAEIGLTKLSDYNFFREPISELIPNKTLLEYDLNSPLFSDYALKKRFIYIPEGKKINYIENSVLDFPLGTVLIKNFFYNSSLLNIEKRKIIETRLLINQKNGWIALPYIWNDDQSEAFLEITGGKISIDLIDKGKIDYNIPDMNQCKSCHDNNGQMVPIGPSVRQLNKSYANGLKSPNQLEKMRDIGWLTLPNKELPKMARWDDLNLNLDDRARAYLDVNCAHCHNQNGPAKNSGLNLSVFETDPYKLGVNKKPVAAGRASAKFRYGIVPGQPNASILLHRMKITEPGTMMPELGRTLPHEEGIELIRAWIQNMPLN